MGWWWVPGCNPVPFMSVTPWLFHSPGLCCTPEPQEGPEVLGKTGRGCGSWELGRLEGAPGRWEGASGLCPARLWPACQILLVT